YDNKTSGSAPIRRISDTFANRCVRSSWFGPLLASCKLASTRIVGGGIAPRPERASPVFQTRPSRCRVTGPARLARSPRTALRVDFVSPVPPVAGADVDTAAAASSGAHVDVAFGVAVDDGPDVSCDELLLQAALATATINNIEQRRPRMFPPNRR